MHVIHHAMLIAGGVGVRHIARGAGKPATPMLHDVQAVGMVGHHMRQFAVQLAAGHVVDDLRAMFERGQRHRSARGVDGQHRPFGNQRVHSAQHTGLLVGFADAFGSRTGGFRSDVDDVGTGFHHRLAMGFGRLRSKPEAAVGEGILRDVEHAHHQRALAIMNRLHINRHRFSSFIHSVLPFGSVRFRPVKRTYE